jgi:isoleucyl-tRNA synthetase/bisphosphoglycerate-dependent phosphoglycerate mutase
MPFDPVDPRQNFPALERGLLKYWQEEDTFKRSIRNRSVGTGDLLEGKTSSSEERFSFYDGPPFATGLPHYGHLLAGTIKDVIPRYQTMKGKRVDRRFGWDCHGLPIENIIEKEHNITNKRQIEEMGVKAFNDLCRKAVQRYTKEWRTVVERMGRWVDMDHDYRTMDPDYMESIWWVFKSLADKNLLSEGYKPMYVCPRCATPLSNFEVTQGYKDRTDMSVIIELPLVDDQNTVLLAWTTTPWSLPGNMWLAVGPSITYAKVKSGDKTYVLSQKLVEKVFAKTEHEVVGTLSAKDLVGKKYVPLFPYFVDTVIASTQKTKKPQTYGERVFKVISNPAVEVSELEGTGIVHLTSSTGEDSYSVAVSEKVDALPHVRMDGYFTPAVTDFQDVHVKPEGKDPMATDKLIVDWMKKRGRVFSSFTINHSYPHCWRCDTPLLPSVTGSWFVAVEKIKEKMLSSNKKTRWVPGHLRDGRFGKWLENARDWAISRARYWGTPLPIWRNTETEDIEVIGSRDDMMKKVPVRFTKLTVLRHAESEGNVSPRYQCKVPGTSLTGTGKKQAEVAAKTFDGETISRIYCSPLARAQETARAIAKRTGAEVIVDERLREVEFGEYEGKSVDFSDLTFVKARRAHKLETGKVESIYHFPGMETWSQVQARVADFLRDVLPKHRCEHIVVVTHADPAINVTHYFTKEDPAKLCNQPYPRFATPKSFFWDHDEEREMDLHKEVVDNVWWPGSSHATSVDLTLVRHGQTDWNKEHLCQGQEADRSLTELGRQQAKDGGQKLKKSKKQFDVIVSSDLKRTRETAAIIAEELGMTVSEYSATYRERSFGDWVGKDLDEILTKHPILVETGEFGIHHETPPNGESLSMFLRRAQNAYEHIAKTYPGKRVLLVTHGGFIQAFMAATQGYSYKEALTSAPKNCEAFETSVNPIIRRIPEVLDCWFESGSMPYAQTHFPFNPASVLAPGTGKKLPVPKDFPADFIAEGIDQTRGWFYTLTVLSAALYEQPSFINCIVNGTVLAEDGKKMSKRLKNYPEPLEVVERQGADAVRFALMSSPAVRAEDLRFSEKVVEDVVRNVILPLWNTYSFFVTYANNAKWEPTATRRTSNHPLDQWIRAEVQDLVNRVTTQLDAYDLSGTCAQIDGTIDALTNWYVRLSRRRFAGKAGLHEGAEALEEMNEEGRLDALSTLYEVLITIAQLIAPFCPFVSESMYLNLVPEPHGSIHLTDWPQMRKLTPKEEKMIRKTRLLRTIASLGMKIRNEHTIRLRQPLAKATIVVPPDLLQGDEITQAEQQVLQEELNVQALNLLSEVDPDMGKSVAMVNARKVGPRLGGRVQEIIQAGKRGDFTVKDDGTVLILDERLSPEEVSIVFQGREGENVMADHGVIVSLDTRVTKELESQGRARELIRNVQQLRKDAGLSVSDRITLAVEGMDADVATHRDAIAQAVNASFGTVDTEPVTMEIDGMSVRIRFKKL